MTHDFKLGECELVISYENTHGDIEMGTILLKTPTGYAHVTDLVWELANYKGNVLEKAEAEIKESLNEKPSYLNED
jgi:phosphopantetheine adenylyltransferase